MGWFQYLTGIDEGTTEVASQLRLDGPILTSVANGRRMHVGRFEMCSLTALRPRAREVARAGRTRVSEVIADAQHLHMDPTSAGALFQVASQFNMLEMISPRVTPEEGIEGYALDRTQGPACAIACGGGTIYRNYLIPFADGVGQRRDRQLDGLAPVAAMLGETIDMRNGYALPDETQLTRIADRLGSMNAAALDEVRGSLTIGIQWDCEVTLGDAGHLVAQAFCSALPIAYSGHPAAAWQPFAQLVLDGAYEATLAAAVVNAASTGVDRVFLTLLGGGAFGNPESWILASIERAVSLYADRGLDVAIVSFGSSNPKLSAIAR